MMSFKVVIRKSALLILLAVALAAAAFSQKPGSPVPRQEKLLNGLKVLMWNDPTAEKVTVKIRIHGGSAFDPQGKEGVMRLLADSIFPSQEQFDFFKEDLGGSLDVASNYDYIQVTATGQSDRLLDILETLAQQITTSEVDKDVTEAKKKVLLAKLEELEKDPSYVADQAVAQRLFGTFPYGRPQLGTKETVAKIDFADLRFNKDRLFSADNATLAISGNINSDYAFRAARRLFGSWLKSDKKIPATFRQPDDPNAIPVEVPFAGAANTKVRYAFRGLARNDKDLSASKILAKILKARLQAAGLGSDVAVSHFARILPGSYVISYELASGKPVTVEATNPVAKALTARITGQEFASAKSGFLSEVEKKDRMDWWLDVDTFKLASVADEQKHSQSATLPDVQRLADQFAKAGIVNVILASPAEPATAKSN